MKKLRAILAGALVWLCIAITFAGLSFIPVLKGAAYAQSVVVSILTIPFATFGASVYYQKGRKDNGLVVGLIMAVTALALDALITVPLIEIPNGNTYKGFFTHPLLWTLVAFNITTVYVYWRLRVKKLEVSTGKI